MQSLSRRFSQEFSGVSLISWEEFGLDLSDLGLGLPEPIHIWLAARGRLGASETSQGAHLSVDESNSQKANSSDAKLSGK